MSEITPTFSVTQQRGTNDAEYQIYKTAAEDLGWTVKTYDEWINS